MATITLSKEAETQFYSAKTDEIILSVDKNGVAEMRFIKDGVDVLYITTDIEQGPISLKTDLDIPIKVSHSVHSSRSEANQQ